MTVHNVGPDSLPIGDRTFHTEKYQIEFRSDQQSLLSLKVWTDAKGLVLAVEDSRTPEYRVILIAYKRFAEPKDGANS